MREIEKGVTDRLLLLGEIFHVAHGILFQLLPLFSSISLKGVCSIFFVCSQTLITENAENLVCAQKTINPKQTNGTELLMGLSCRCMGLPPEIFDTWEILCEIV